MDVAYDHIQEEALSPDAPTKPDLSSEQSSSSSAAIPKSPTLNTEFQEAYKSFSASPWGAKLGGFFSDVKKQSETYYKEVQQEASAARGDALKGFSDLRSTLVSRARGMSAGQGQQQQEANGKTVGEGTAEVINESEKGKDRERTESESLRESEGLIARFRSEAAKRLKEVQKAEDAADEALLKFGTNVRNFLRDAVTVAPPSADDTKNNNNGSSSKILFESKDQDGKRVIHTTRFDAQLHAIHSSFDSFLKDPESLEFEKWKEGFDVEKQTEAIGADLEKHEELRRAMERLVPEKVEHGVFWRRYYFLRMVVESEEQRRREMLKGAALDPEELISWDDDSDSSAPSTPHPSSQSHPQPAASTTSTINPPTTKTPISSTSHSSTTTIQTPAANTAPTSSPSPSSSTEPRKDSSLHPSDAIPRRSQDQHSQPDSDASYDLVSGATSRAPGSPKDKDEDGSGKKVEESDDEPDWE